MRTIVLTRIDERLIHGQIATQWLKIKSNPNYILIVDEKLPNDMLQKRMLQIVADQLGIAVEIKNTADAATFLKEDAQDGQNIMLMSKVPGPLLQLIKDGVHLDEIILGNMGMAAGRKRFTRNISASEAELQEFREITSAGVPIYQQMVPTDPKKSIDNLL